VDFLIAAFSEGNLLDSNKALFEISRTSEAQYESLSRDFKTNTKLLKEMKSDLDSIFEKIQCDLALLNPPSFAAS